MNDGGGATSECWNCRTLPDHASDEFCSRCGESLRPDSEQARLTHSHIQFLLKEVERWESAPPRWRRDLQARYKSRLQFLEPLCLGEPPAVPRAPTQPASPPPIQAPQAAPPQIEEEWHNDAPTPIPAPVKIANRPPGIIPAAAPAPVIQRGRVDEAAYAREFEELGFQTPVQAPPESGESLDDLRQVLAERSVNSTFMVAALLLLAAYIGFLKHNWDNPLGQFFAALTMMASPIFFFWFAHWLRVRLPQTSRIMSVIGGLLTPMGLLSVNQFHVLGFNLPSRIWSPVSFGVSAGVLIFLTFRLPETACLYLSVLSAFLAGLTSGNNLFLALLAFGGAAALLYVSSTTAEPTSDGTAEDLRPHYQRLSHLLAAGGLLSGLMRSQDSWESAATIFLLGGVYYAGTAYLGRSVKALLVSAVTGMAGFWALQNLFHLSSPMLGLCSLIQGSLYLSRGKQLMDSEDETDKALGTASFALGAGVTGVILTLSLGWTLVGGLWDNFAGYTAYEQMLCILTGTLGALYYGFAAYRYRNPVLLYASAGCLTYAYFVTIVLTWHSQLALYRFLLVVLPLVWQGLALALRRLIPEQYLTPWVLSGTLLTTLILPLNLATQLAHGAHASPFDLWIYLGSAQVFLVAALWQGQSVFLYPALTSLVIAYTTFLAIQPPHEVKPNLGFLFLPLVVALTGLTKALEKRLDYALPVGRVGLLLALFFSAIQVGYLIDGQYAKAALPLAVYALGFAVCGRLFRSWTLLATPFDEFAYFWSGLCLLTSISAFGDLNKASVGLALALCAAGAVGGAIVPSLRFAAAAGLLWCLWPCFFGPKEYALGSALVWVLPAVLLGGAGEPREEAAPTMVSRKTWLLGAWTATALGFVGAGRTQFSIDACLGLALLMALQLVVSWRWSDSVANLCAIISGVLGCAGLVVGQPESIVFPSWWFLQLIFTGYAFAARSYKPSIYPTCQTVAKLLGLGILVVLPHGWWSCLTAFVYGGAYAVGGVLTGSVAEFSAGSLLFGWTLLLASLNGHWPAAATSLAWVGLAWLYVLLAPVLPAMRNFCLRYGPVLTALSLLWALPSQDATISLLAGAALWGVRGLLVPENPEWSADERVKQLAMQPWGPANYHVGFFFAYSAWIKLMPHSSPLEGYTLPIGLWLLTWTELFLRERASQALGWRRLGLFVLLFPSLLLSLGGLEHTFYALGLGAVVLFAGTALTVPTYISVGQMAVLLEIAIQALKKAVYLPWYVWAFGVAVLLLALGFYNSYRRENAVKARMFESEDTRV